MLSRQGSLIGSFQRQTQFIKYNFQLIKYHYNIFVILIEILDSCKATHFVRFKFQVKTQFLNIIQWAACGLLIPDRNMCLTANSGSGCADSSCRAGVKVSPPNQTPNVSHVVQMPTAMTQFLYWHNYTKLLLAGWNSQVTYIHACTCTCLFSKPLGTHVLSVQIRIYTSSANKN